MQKLEFYQSIVAEDIAKDSSSNDLFVKIDKAYNCDWSAPGELAQQRWWRNMVSTAAHDAIEAPTRVFAQALPHIDIMPSNSSPQELERVGKIERGLLWHFDLANRRNTSSRPLWSISQHAVKYAKVAFQVIYLPHYTSTKDEGNGYASVSKKHSARFGDFDIRIHDPKNVHARYSSYGIESVSLVTMCKAWDIVKDFENIPSAKKGIDALKKSLTANGADLQAELRTRNVVLYDYCDSVVRVQWYAVAESIDVTGAGGGSAVELMREEHGLPFIPWVVRYDDHPLLKPIIDAKLWENSNILRSLEYAQVIATAAQPRIKTITMDGEGTDVSFDDPAGQIQLRQGEDAQVFPPAQLDPNLRVLNQQADSDMFQTTASRILGAIDQVAGASTPFATINAMLQTAIAQLGRYKRLAETALEDMFYLMLQWLDYEGESLMAWETENRSEKTSRGGQINIMPAKLIPEEGEVPESAVYFDPESIHIKVELQSETTTNEQARINQAILLSERLPYSPEDALEMNGFEYTEANKASWALSMMERAEIQGVAQEISAQYQLKIQQVQMQMQMEMQQMQMQMQQMQQQQAQQQATREQAMQNMNPQSAANAMSAESAMSTMQGIDNRNGEQVQSPSAVLTREDVTKKAPGGEQVV